MVLSTWLSLLGVCLLGAMSPGPSLAVVLRSTLAGGRAAINGFLIAFLNPKLALFMLALFSQFLPAEPS